MNEWIQTLLACRAGNEAAVLVTVASVRGSTPREPGAKMVVTASQLIGTIGGGNLELQAASIARDMLASGRVGELRRFPLGASLGQCCGGLVNLMFEPVAAEVEWLNAAADLVTRGEDCVIVGSAGGTAAAGKLVVSSGATSGCLGDPALDVRAQEFARSQLNNDKTSELVAMGEERRLYFFDRLRVPDFNVILFGAGHVGRALVRVLDELPCRVTWVDSREDQFPAQVPANVSVEVSDTPTAEVDAARPGSYFLVMTHSHALDQELAERILRRADFAYFGLIGSASKRRQFEKRMECRGVPPERFTDMTCPIGVPGISGKQPAAIAIAVAAELLQVRDRHSVRMNEPSKAHRA